MMNNKVSLEIDLKFGPIHDNKFMKVFCSYQNLVQEIVPNQQNRAKCQIEINLPAVVKLEFLGKDLEKDTLLDRDGNIIKDLHVEITQLSIDGFVIDSLDLYHKLFLETVQGDTIQTCYIGFNGTVKINLPKSTVFAQVMNYKNLNNSN